MLVLLPLRGWAGDLMAIEMAAGLAMDQTAGAMPPACPLHAQMTVDADADAGADQSPADPQDRCGSCQLCLPLAEACAAELNIAVFAAHIKPLLGGIAFLSAPPAPNFKPPIS